MCIRARSLGQAHKAFPASHWLAIFWARSSQSIAEFESALRVRFRAGRRRHHRDAMLGGSPASYLMRHRRHCTTTRMIELGTWYIGDAYTGGLEPIQPQGARAGVVGRRDRHQDAFDHQRLHAGRLDCLDRKDLPTAVLRFDRSFELDVTNCDAVWMAGLVHVDLEAWPLASPKFARAMSCFSNAAAQAKTDLAALDARLTRRRVVEPARPGSPSAREAHQGHGSGCRAIGAVGLQRRTGFRAWAEGHGAGHVEMAIVHPRMKEKGEALQAAIEKMP